MLVVRNSGLGKGYMVWYSIYQQIDLLRSSAIPSITWRDARRLFSEALYTLLLLLV
jgi:hypothetical protein